jgi:GNAT superfamily N-acetyltransferase
MPDMLVKLYDLQPDPALVARLAQQQVRVHRVLAPDRRRVLRFIESNAGTHWPQESTDSWLSECETVLSHQPPGCFVAVKQRQIVGFACYDATAKGFLGPMGVLREHQRHGVGKALLLDALFAMSSDGYGYAVIGWPAKSAMGFYAKTVGARVIDDSAPGLYSRLVDA